MHETELLRIAPLLAMLIVAAATDLRWRRIPNWLTVAMMLSGLADSIVLTRAISPWSSLAGLSIGFAITFVLFALGALGGGDVKLMAGIGAWMGAIGVIKVFAVAAIIGMILVLVQSARQGRLMALFRSSLFMAISVFQIDFAGAGNSLDAGRSSVPQKSQLPYAVPALLGTILVILEAKAFRLF